MKPNIPVPLLCKQSLWDLFDDPCTDLARKCWNSPWKIISNTDAFLDRMAWEVTNKAALMGSGPVPYIVLVRWLSANDVVDDIRN